MQFGQMIHDKLAAPYEEVFRQKGIVVASPFAEKLNTLIPGLLIRHQLKAQHTDDVQWISSEVYESAWTQIRAQERALVKTVRQMIDNHGRPPGNIGQSTTQQSPSQQEAAQPPSQSPAIPPSDTAPNNGNTAQAVTNSVGMKLVLIPAGEFRMGSGESAEAMVGYFNSKYSWDLKADTYKSEHPQHRVRVTKPFYLGSTHVTRGQFRQFVGDSGYKTDAEKDGKGGWGYDATEKKVFWQKPEYTWSNVGFDQTDKHPVVNVSWNDATAYCQWLSRKEGKEYRLPTEAEWEYACRAGTTTRYWCGDDAEALAQVDNVADATLKAKIPDLDNTIPSSDGYAFTSPVGSFRANPFGLYDMHGNASQWCADWYETNYYSASASDNPRGPDFGTPRVIRGGSWAFRTSDARSAFRSGSPPDFRFSIIGFRVARTP